MEQFPTVEGKNIKQTYLEMDNSVNKVKESSRLFREKNRAPRTSTILVSASSKPTTEETEQRNEVVSSKPESGRKPKSMRRATSWNTQVENGYRFLAAGFRDLEDYVTQYNTPELWPETGFVKCLQSKQTGYYLYFRPYRECADKHLNKIKLYTY